MVSPLALTLLSLLALRLPFGHHSGMRNWLHLFLSAPLLFSFAISLRAQSSSTPASSASPAAQSPLKLDYSDSTSGLEHLVKDIVKAQRENDPARADVLLRSLVLPHPKDWYGLVFGPVISEQADSAYQETAARIPAEIAEMLLNATQKGTEVMAQRFEKSCDDGAGLEVFGTLQLRLRPVPLYEVRLIHGQAIRRLFAFAYVDGAFRFILPPTPNDPGFDFALPADSPPVATQTSLSAEPRLKVPAMAQEAKLVHTVQPFYPSNALMEQLEGVVQMRALIGKDGSVEKLYVVKGYCSLAESAVNAVRQWRYHPTFLRNRPAEVDTEVDVVFHLPSFY